MTLRAAVLGSPIAHSLSPALHRAAYAALGLAWRYDAIEVDEQALPGFLGALGPQWAGLSLTMPLKRAVVPLLASRDPLVEALGVCNTVLLPSRAGHNTDVEGLVAAIGAPVDGSAVVLGGGATAASAIAALAALGARDVLVHVRDAVRAGGLVGVGARLGVDVRFGGLEDPWERADVVVSTVPAGAAPVRPGLGLLVDVVYHPWPTPLALGWRGTVVPGTEMLLYQAAEQVRLMTGRTAPIAAMRAALDRAALALDGEAPSD